MKLRILTLMLMLLMLLSSCTQQTSPVGALSTMIPGVRAQLPDASPPEEMNRQETAALYFRYMDEPYLAAEYRVVTQSANKPYEQALLSALVSGPSGLDLTSLFPAGVQVLSASRQGRTLFVTLSKEIMNPYPDEVIATYSTRDAILRRRLCMQSIAATVTENCDVDQVQILVQQDAAMTGSLRLEKRYFLTGESGLTEPFGRDESLLLTPHTTMNVILQLCRQQDWQRLYHYLIRVDQTLNASRPSYESFVAAMDALPALTEYACSTGSVSQYGQTAAFVCDASLRLEDGRQVDKTGSILRLTRENGLWRITLDSLTGWLEVTP
ncbi:MAG: GerMN domain-containing protein [Clostridia bacterium]|nr:GerMN domain-containing protein [Clostridia bacterium]